MYVWCIYVCMYICMCMLVACCWHNSITSQDTLPRWCVACTWSRYRWRYVHIVLFPLHMYCISFQTHLQSWHCILWWSIPVKFITLSQELFVVRIFPHLCLKTVVEYRLVFGVLIVNGCSYMISSSSGMMLNTSVMSASRLFSNIIRVISSSVSS